MTGSRGPLPKPAALKLLEGNPGRRALDLSDGVNPRVEIPSAPKHLGISLIVLDMRSPGITVTPIDLISGKSSFCQVFLPLTDACRSIYRVAKMSSVTASSASCPARRR